VFEGKLAPNSRPKKMTPQLMEAGGDGQWKRAPCTDNAIGDEGK